MRMVFLLACWSNAGLKLSFGPGGSNTCSIASPVEISLHELTQSPPLRVFAPSDMQSGMIWLCF